MCITDHHNMTLAVKVALNPNTCAINQPTQILPSGKGLSEIEETMYIKDLTSQTLQSYCGSIQPAS